MRLVRLSALLFCRFITAHTAAGNQPIRVHWSTKQATACKIFPLSKKDSEGNMIAISVMYMK
jgi:hypothetical protein